MSTAAVARSAGAGPTAARGAAAASADDAQGQVSAREFAALTEEIAAKAVLSCQG